MKNVNHGRCVVVKEKYIPLFVLLNSSYNLRLLFKYTMQLDLNMLLEACSTTNTVTLIDLSLLLYLDSVSHIPVPNSACIYGLYLSF